KHVIETRKHELLRLPGVEGVRPGFKYEDGWSTGRPAIIVSVRAIKDPDQLPASERIPAQVDGVEVEVVPMSLQEQLRELTGAQRGGLAEQVPEFEELALPGEPWRVVEPEEVRALAAYVPPPDAELEPVHEEMRLVLRASPDAGWPTLKDFLEG